MASGDGGIMLDSIEMDSLSTKNTDFKTNSLTKTSESEDDGNLIFLLFTASFNDRLNLTKLSGIYRSNVFFFFKKLIERKIFHFKRKSLI